MENKNLLGLKNLLVKAQSYGLDVSNLLSKVNNALLHIKSTTIKVVLMGAFSDGKTTVIAGLTGQLESNMKIAIEESSDELAFYHLPALGRNFEIVDTPGLFGTKEKDIKGRQIRYSDITRDYISQAHIVIYVTDAVNPLKDSHKEILKFVLRDLGKLSSTVFVINKMDEAGYELIDDDDFNRGEKIKRDTFTNKLNEVISLTQNEKQNLNVVCVAANPNGRGLSTHFSSMDKYLKRSRIDKLQEAVLKVANSSDKEDLRKASENSSVSDLVNQSLQVFRKHLNKSNSEIEDLANNLQDLRLKYARVREVTINNKSLLMNELRTTEREIINAVKNASMEEFNVVVQTNFGEKGERLTQSIDNIFSKYAEMNNTAFNQAHIQATFDKMGDLTKGLINSMSNMLKHTKISADMVKGARDIVASGFKFKPWGAVNLGKTLTKAIGWVAIAIDVFMWVRNHREQKKFKDAKENLIDGCKVAFKQADTYLSPEIKYFENFAPGILAIEKAITNTEINLTEFRNVNSTIRGFITELEKWVSINDFNAQY